MKKFFILLSFAVCILKLNEQNVCIGTSTPNASAQLDVNSTDKGMLIPRMSTAEINAISSPASGLMVYNTTDSTIYIKRDTGWVAITIASPGNSTQQWNNSNGNIYNVNTNNVGIGTNSPTLGRLVVQGVASGGNTNAVFGNGSSGISFQQNWPTIGFNQYRNSVTGNGRFMSTGYAAIQYVDPSSGTLGIDMLGFGGINSLTGSGTRAMTILSNCNVGIRNGGGDASLWVSRGTGSNGTAVFAGTTYWSHFNYGTAENTYIRAGKAGGHVFINDDVTSGNIFMGAGAAKMGFNTQSPSYTIDVNQVGSRGLRLVNSGWGNLGWAWSSYKANSDASNPITYFELEYDGHSNPIVGWFDDGGSYSQNSDIRFKENIHPMESILGKVMQLKVDRYHFYHLIDTDPKKVSMGFIAQEAKAQFPELISIINCKDEQHPNDFTDHHAINYSGFSVVAIKAIQEQQQEIEALKKDNEMLKMDMGELKKLIQEKVH